MHLANGNDSFMIGSYASHNDWNITKTTARRDIYIYGNGEVYLEVKFTVEMKRKSSYFYRLFVAPAAVCMFVIPVIHFLPPSSNEKLTLGMLSQFTYSVSKAPFQYP